MIHSPWAIRQRCSTSSYLNDIPPDAQSVVRLPGREASPDASAGRGGGTTATLPRPPHLRTHPRGPAARRRRASPSSRQWSDTPSTIVGSRKEDRSATAKSSKDRLQARSIIEVMIANWQHADLASAFTEAGDRGDHWRAAIRTSIANYDDDFQRSFRTELAKGVTELGANAANYDLADKPTK